MDWDDEDADTSLAGSILRAVGTGMLIACVAFAIKAISGGAAPVDILPAAFAGVVGTAAMVSASCADRQCVCEEDEATAVGEAAKAASLAMTGPDVRAAELYAAEECERRFTLRLERESGRGVGRGA